MVTFGFREKRKVKEMLKYRKRQEVEAELLTQATLTELESWSGERLEQLLKDGSFYVFKGVDGHFYHILEEDFIREYEKVD